MINKEINKEALDYFATVYALSTLAERNQSASIHTKEDYIEGFGTCYKMMNELKGSGYISGFLETEEDNEYYKQLNNLRNSL